MSPNNPTTSTEARQLVQRIAQGYGWISQRARDASDQEALDAIDLLQENLGIAVRTLATNLYKSQARFVFELIQNAEDNSYRRAKSNGTTPYIKFTVSRERVVIDSNEDGFTSENVLAICKVGQSTKKGTGAQQYIGEKGIGFKSVFMVASKVHIQSGSFSFFFEHTPGSKGMGLVTPVWESREIAQPDPLTRMTLTLLDKLDYSDLVSQFDALPDTFLLFLNQLSAIAVDKLDFAGNISESTTFSRISDNASKRTTLSKVRRTTSNKPRTTLKHYHMTRKSLTDLSPDEQRDHNTAEVVLAFPLDDESKPIIGRQDVHAYLPIGDFGFSFLIQSDFITQASRQDVMENRRNKDILDGIAEAFLDAVLQFCKHPTLQYKWPRYIPQDIPNVFWASLKEKIHKLLKEHAVVRGYNHGSLRCLNQLKILPSHFKDESGNPIVADLPDEIYLASEYQQQDIAALQCLGLSTMNFEAMIARLHEDLKKPSSRSRFKSPQTNDDWHTRAAKLLLRPFVFESPSKFQHSIRDLACIPLQSGTWTAITEGAVFLPQTDFILIPTDLGLGIVDPPSITNATRNYLFKHLGVKSASLETVSSLVLARYEKESSPIDFETSLRDIQFLYLTQLSGTKVDFSKLRSLRVFNHRNVLTRHEEDLYFQSDEKYGFQKLMEPVLDTAPYNSGNFGSFIHPEYCKRIELHEKRGGSHHKFKTFLLGYVGILNRPRLSDPSSPNSLSSIFKYIIEACPEKLLGTLKAHWAFYEAYITSSQQDSISQAVVPCNNIGPRALKDSFLPSDTLTRICDEFIDIQEFPFLQIENGSNLEGWSFLKDFHVGIEENLDFYLQVLLFSKVSDRRFRYDLYEVIQRKLWVSDNQELDTKRVEKFISENELVRIPEWRGKSSSWTSPAECLWNAPDYMTTRHALLPSLPSLNSPILAIFFQTTLKVREILYSDFIFELDAIKKGANERKHKPAVDTIRDIYLRLQTIVMNGLPPNMILTWFERNGLIYDIQRQRWSTPSACLWSKDAQVPGKSTISGQYENFKFLFVDALKVKIPDLRLLVEELKRVAQASPSISDVKSLIWQINAFCPNAKDLETLKEAEIFPVRKKNGKTSLQARSGRYSIIDRQPWADAFEEKLDFLDFSLKEVKLLEPFLLGMKMNNYLSVHMFERSSFQGDAPEPNMRRTHDVRRRAYAISRCATHFGSARAKSDSQVLYQLLLNAKVYETDGIIGNLEHSMAGETVIVEAQKSNLHLDETTAGLKIYVPKDPENQELCYLRVLPLKFFNHTMMAGVDGDSTRIFKSEAVSVIAAILAASDKIIDSVLEDAGIIPVSYPDVYQQQLRQSHPEKILPGPDINGPGSVESCSISVESGSERDTETPVTTTPPSPNPGVSITASSAYRAIYRSSILSQPIYTSSSPPNSNPEPVILDYAPHLFTPGSNQVEYRRLLDSIITSARNKRGALPSRGAFNMEALLNALPVETETVVNQYDLPFGVRNENQLSHDMKVGASGELYAFEILSRLETSLPGFGRENWQSTIRKHVKVHENYHDMEPWRGAETADITYDDIQGELTQLLIANGYLEGSAWAHAKPKYFLEVKTTTKECATRLFCSKSQYKRMERMKLGNHSSPEVYIILRVFYLDKDSIDMRLFVDPAGMEERGELQFTSESYSVVPDVRGGG